MATSNLTEAFIGKLKAPASGRLEIWDAKLTGFGLRVSHSGKRTFFVKYRAGGIYRRFTIGDTPPLTAAQARDKATEILATVELGGDPSGDRQADNKALTGSALVERFNRDYVDIHCKASTAAEYKRLLKTHFLPKFGNRRAASIQPGEIHSLYSSMSATPYNANRVLAVVRSMFHRAEEWGVIPNGSNPCVTIRGKSKFKEEKRKRFLSPKEIQQLGLALRKAEKSKSEHLTAILAIRLLMLTGARKSEILTAKWEYFDAKKGVLALPDSKTGAKVIPLGAPALALLKSAKRAKDNPYICWGRFERGHLVGLQSAWERIREAAGLDGLRLHDLRHSFASVAVSGGSSLPLIGAILGHKDQATTQRYAHTSADPVRAVADTTANTMAALMQGRKGNVIPMKRGNAQ